MPHEISDIVWLWFSRNNKDTIPYNGGRPDHAYVYCEGWASDDHLLVIFNGHDSCTRYLVPETHVIVDISTGEVAKPGE